MYWASVICNSYKPWTIQELQPFMISLQDKRELSKIVETKTFDEAVPINDRSNTAIPNPKLMSVKKSQDPLFWTLFLAKYGETEYKRALKNPKTEMKEKKIVADHFHKLGSGKISSDLSIRVSKKGCNKIVEDIITQPKLLLSSIHAFCHYYSFNIYIVDMKKRIYLQFLLDRHEQFENVILYRKQDKTTPEYFVDIPSPSAETQLRTINTFKEDLLGLISFEKSLKSVSNYKLSELQQLYTKLGMTDAPKKKHELYEKIIVHCVWEVGK
jgi:hypothetical protein